MQKLLQNETTDEHGAAEPQPKKSHKIYSILQSSILSILLSCPCG